MATSGNRPHSPRKQPAASWQKLGELIGPLTKREQNQLEQFRNVLAEVWPLKREHRDRLPADILSLSRQLTSQRNLLGKPYWSRPGFISAYLYYFLPWNMIRLARLLKNLPLPQPEICNGKFPGLIDAGAGPLTLPLALWLAKPDWRSQKIVIFAIDKARQPLELGKKILSAWARQTGETAWPVSLHTSSIYTVAEILHKSPDRSYWPWLMAAANTLNEPGASKKKCKTLFKPVEQEEPTACALLESWAPVWQKRDLPAVHLLFVEPGTRLGGTTIMNLRQCGQQMGLTPLSPCTHTKKCPLASSAVPKSSYQRTWCHFTFVVDQVPGWLAKLSRESGLEKASLSISALLLTTGAQNNTAQCRVISRSFAVDGIDQNCCYGCSASGLLLLPRCTNPGNGLLTLAEPTDQRDGKSGAKIARPK